MAQSVGSGPVYALITAKSAAQVTLLEELPIEQFRQAYSSDKQASANAVSFIPLGHFISSFLAYFKHCFFLTHAGSDEAD